jgi:hypothetical protein
VFHAGCATPPQLSIPQAKHPKPAGAVGSPKQYLIVESFAAFVSRWVTPGSECCAPTPNAPSCAPLSRRAAPSSGEIFGDPAPSTERHPAWVSRQKRWNDLRADLAPVMAVVKLLVNAFPSI